MIINLVRDSRKIIGDGGSKLYVVVTRFSSGVWGFCDFWGCRYVSDNYLEAVKMKRRIRKKQYKNIWPKDSLEILKITL